MVDRSRIKIKRNESIDTISSTMGCRTQNGPDINFKDSFIRNIKHIINGNTDIIDLITSYGIKDGRGNICPVTIILPTIAMEVKEECDEKIPGYSVETLIESFMKRLDTKISEAKDMLIERFNWICKQPVDAAKFMYENNTMYGYNPDEGIVSALKHGTLTIGMIGMNETTHALVGEDHISGLGRDITDKVVNLYSQRCKEFKEKYKLNFGVYFTPKFSWAA